MAPNRHMTCVLKVDTQSSGWEKSVTKVIKRVKDVSYTIDTTRGYVHISGTINPQKLLTDVKKAGKAGRRAELVHVDCGGNSYSHSNYGSYGYHGYNGGYGYSYPYHHTYHHYVPRPGAYLQSHHARVLPLPPPPPPTSYAYDPYYPNPSWNLM